MAKKITREDLKIRENYIKLLEEEKNNISSTFNLEKRRSVELEIISQRQRIINELIKEQKETGKDYKEIIKNLNKEQEISKKNEKKLNNELNTQKKIRTDINRYLRIGIRYLHEQDKIIKSTILSLGMSGDRADFMRQSFEDSAQYVARLGGSLKDVAAIMLGYADITGRARALSQENVEAITAIYRGTGLSVEQATKLAAQYEFMGKDAKATMDYVQGVLDTSERMGVNTEKVLIDVSNNFKRLSTFTFQKGVRGFAEMAQNAERTRISIQSALDVAEHVRTLDNVIRLGAELQVMGGEFAKMDPLHWLYTARNEPEKLQEELSRMTRGIYTLRQTSEGAFEKFISPADRDRLSHVAKSLGIAQDEMFQAAQRGLELSMIADDLEGMGLTTREKELVEGAAQLSSETGKMFVEIGGATKAINDLTVRQARSFAEEQKLLESRAKEALTFNEAWEATINEFKSILLPLLRDINSAIRYVRPYVEKFADWIGAIDSALVRWVAVGAGLVGGAIALKGAASFVAAKLATVKLLGAGAGATGGAAATLARGTGAGRKAAGIGRGVGLAGVGVGIAGIGTGAGVKIAAEGISELADAMSRLTPEQGETLQKIGYTLASMFTATVAVGVIAVGVAGKKAAIGLLAIGAAAVGVGFGIKLASEGVAKMTIGIGEMIERSKEAGPAMLQIGAGLMGMAGAFTAFNLGMTGMVAFRAILGSIAKRADALNQVGNAFENIATVMRGNKEDFQAVENAVNSISNMNIKEGGILSDLVNLLKHPLKVEFANDSIQLRNNITLELDNDVLMNKIIDANVIVRKIEDRRINK